MGQKVRVKKEKTENNIEEEKQQEVLDNLFSFVILTIVALSF